MWEIILQIHYFLECLIFVPSFEWRSSRKELVDYTAECPEIGGFTGRFICEEFGGDVFCGTDEGVCARGGVIASVVGWGEGRARAGTVGEWEELGGAKVGYFYAHLCIEEDTIVNGVRYAAGLLFWF